MSINLRKAKFYVINSTLTKQRNFMSAYLSTIVLSNFTVLDIRYRLQDIPFMTLS